MIFISRWLKELLMADFFEQDWSGYKIRLRPNDRIRDPINRMPFLLDLIPYFSASYISFDLRVFLPRKQSTKWYSGIIGIFPEYSRKEQDKFHYEWQLCDDDNKPVGTGGKNAIRFYNSSGCGDFELATDKSQRKMLGKSGYITFSDYLGFGFRKQNAIDIGRLNKFAHYKLLMRFTSNTGVASDWKQMVSFRLFDKDSFRMSGCLPVIISFIVTILTVFVLRSCGLQ